MIEKVAEKRINFMNEEEIQTNICFFNPIKFVVTSPTHKFLENIQ